MVYTNRKRYQGYKKVIGFEKCGFHGVQASCGVGRGVENGHDIPDTGLSFLFFSN